MGGKLEVGMKGMTGSSPPHMFSLSLLRFCFQMNYSNQIQLSTSRLALDVVRRFQDSSTSLLLL